MNIFKKKTHNYPATVEEIHSEFEIASDILLKEAKEALAKLEKAPEEKIELLSKLGFNQTEEVVQGRKIKQQETLNKQTIDFVTYYSVNYPNNKFINGEQIKKICEKYNLVFGNVSDYKGFVPQSKLEQIANFKLLKKDEELVAYYDYNDNLSGFFHIDKLTTVAQKDLKTKGSHREFSVYSGYYRINPPLMICAPLKDMDIRGKQLEGHKLVNIPDPVVLRPVNGGYLILAAWGDEASDPIVVNQQYN